MIRYARYGMLFARVFMMLVLPLCAQARDVAADAFMFRFFENRGGGAYDVGEFFGNLYVKQRVKVLKNNLALNTFPDMTRFDRGVRNYVTELFYQMYYTDYGILELRRRSYNTSFRHGKGEIGRAVDFMKVNPCDAMLLQGRIYSPLSSEYSGYYRYSVDSVSCDGRSVKIAFESRFDNIRLLTDGWAWIEDSCFVREFSMRGWDEQSRFNAVYFMGGRADGCSVVDSVRVDIDYNFLGNKLKILCGGFFDYKYVLPVNRAAAFRMNGCRYDLSGSADVVWDTARIADRREYARMNRPVVLDDGERALLGETVNSGGDSIVAAAKKKKLRERSWVWDLGDGMISSHYIDWEGGGVKLSPVINPSSVDYSSSRGLSYKLSMNVRNSMGGGREFRLKPQIGYNFKQRAFYWNVGGRFVYNPRRQGVLGFEFGEGNQVYSSVMLDAIKDIALDSLKFKNLNLNYFRNFYMEPFHESELANGLKMLVGVNFHKRVLWGNADKVLDEHGVALKKNYVQFAPHLRFTWQPGMYYYMKGNEKVNLGSRYPVVAWDVAQGFNGAFGSNSIYTRSELDVQCKFGHRNGDVIYLRFGAGGYFYTKDVYFVDYTFLRQSNLPVDRSEELGGVFQLLDSEWYNAANKYLRAHLTYEAPFLSLQKIFPRVKFFQNEYVYANMLFISHLNPYTELGYGVATPYVDMGMFVSAQNLKMHRIGYKISFYLFSD